MANHRPVPALRLVLLALVVGSAAASSSARQPKEMAFSQAELFFELNDTDGDLGIHAAIDGDPWTNLQITDPGGGQVLSIATKGNLRVQGLTQLSFESAEPAFDELDPAEFFERFPAGRYEITARTQEKTELESTARLSQVLPAPPENVLVSGVPAPEDCEATPPVVTTPVTIKWEPVTESHPEIGKTGPITVVRYQLFVERDGVKFSVDLPPSVTQFEVPDGVIALGDQFKFEIIVREESGNNTALESCFRVK